MTNDKEVVGDVSEVLDKLQQITGAVPEKQAEDTVAQRISYLEQYLDNSPRKFRRKFVRESFSDRFKKHINTKQDVPTDS